MLHKFKIASCAFILCLFGLTLMTVSPVFADDVEYDTCDTMGKKKGAKYPYKNRMNCFSDLSDSLISQVNEKVISEYGDVVNNCTGIRKKGGAKYPYKNRMKCYERLAPLLVEGYTCHKKSTETHRTVLKLKKGTEISQKYTFPAVDHSQRYGTRKESWCQRLESHERWDPCTDCR